MIGPPFNAAVLQKQPYQPKAYIAVAKAAISKDTRGVLGGHRHRSIPLVGTNILPGRQAEEIVEYGAQVPP